MPAPPIIRYFVENGHAEMAKKVRNMSRPFRTHGANAVHRAEGSRDQSANQAIRDF